MDSELANDRTFLAWLRTGIALFGLGFVVAKVALIVQPDATRLENKNLYSAVGVLIVLSGAALVVVGYLQQSHCWWGWWWILCSGRRGRLSGPTVRREPSRRRSAR
jgi:uncharacterized membrane protein YidH (DUF202 family)